MQMPFFCSDWLISQPALLIEEQDEPRSVGNKCNTVIMRIGQQSSLDLDLQAARRATSQFLFRESMGKGVFHVESCCRCRGIGAGSAARI